MTTENTKIAIAEANANVFESPVKDRGEISLFPIDATGTIVATNEPTPSKKLTIADSLKRELACRNSFVDSFNRFCYKVAVSVNQNGENFEFEVRNGLSIEIACEYMRQNKFEVKVVVGNVISAKLNPYWDKIKREINYINDKAKKAITCAIAAGKSEIKIETENKLSESEMNTVIRFFKSEGLNARLYNGVWTLSF